MSGYRLQLPSLDDPYWEQDYFIYSFILELSKTLTAFNLQQPTRVALLLSENRDKEELSVYDPQDLLPSVSKQVSEYFRPGWSSELVPVAESPGILELPGIITRGMSTEDGVHAQWFFEEPFQFSDLTIAWMSEASRLLFSQLPFQLGRQWSSALVEALEHRAARIVQEHFNRFYSREQRPPFSILEMLAELSITREEGTLPVGNIVIAPPEIARELPQVRLREPGDSNSPKLVRKILSAVSGTDYSLILDYSRILGFAVIPLVPESGFSVEFGATGGILKFRNEDIARIRNGQFLRAAQAPHLPLLESALKSKFSEADRDSLFKIVSNVIEHAHSQQFGCTLAIFDPTPEQPISGRYFDNAQNATNIQPLLASMAHVDGAIHINLAGHIEGFGCLLDGKARLDLEDLSKGARHNSAIRFTAERSQAVIVVVSEDGPVGVFLDGRSQIGSIPLPNPKVLSKPLLLGAWLDHSSSD